MLLRKRFFALFIITAYFFHSANRHSADAAALIHKMRPSSVYAEVNADTPIYAGSGESFEIIGVMLKSTKVEILEDKTMEWYYVSDTKTNETGWINGIFLNIPPERAVNRELLNPEDIEDYVNFLGFDSKTNHFVYVDIDRQKVYVFSGGKNKWSFISSITCSTGKNGSPTVRGHYEISDRGAWFYSERLKSGGEFWVRFYGTYLFHSVPMDKNKRVIDNTLGEKISNGCVRMSVKDAEWFYNNVPDKTSVVIN